ncbi:hypothetical protein P692DRAFT_20834468 [Suillus brevipes Sb2]|nr:hypothetical protein P692DRAFT_20834468 [Suillus brevipes Sb2]
MQVNDSLSDQLDSNGFSELRTPDILMVFPALTFTGAAISLRVSDHIWSPCVRTTRKHNNSRRSRRWFVLTFGAMLIVDISQSVDNGSGLL